MECPRTPGCPLYAQFKMEATRHFWIETYCRSENHTTCKRLALALEKKPVPPKLLPNGDSLK